jgi:hypothetical protein
MARASSPERKYARVVSALEGAPGVTVGGGRRGFGESALKVGGRIFAMLSSKGGFVVKLPAARVEALVTSGDGRRFDPGHGRLMKEWLEVEPASTQSWLGLAREAMAFVGGARRPDRRKA